MTRTARARTFLVMPASFSIVMTSPSTSTTRKRPGNDMTTTCSPTWTIDGTHSRAAPNSQLAAAWPRIDP